MFLCLFRLVCMCVRVRDVTQSTCSPLSRLLPRVDDGPLGIRTTDRKAWPLQNQLTCWHNLPLLPPSVYPKQVPDAIKSQYQFPPPLIAPAAIRDGELICNGIPEESQMHLLNSEHLATQAEQQEVSGGRAGIPNVIFLSSQCSCHWK